jgi:hypothetical protein
LQWYPSGRSSQLSVLHAWHGSSTPWKMPSAQAWSSCHKRQESI